MKRIISVLMILGFVWMFAVPSLVGQEKEKEFKSALDDITDPKEARAILMKSFIDADSVLVVEDWEKDLRIYRDKIETWISNELFVQEDVSKLIHSIPVIKEQIYLTTVYLDPTFEETISIMASRDPTHPQNWVDPLSVTNQSYYSESYTGTLEDVKKAEKYLYEAKKLINKTKNSIVLKLIRDNKTGGVSRIRLK